MYELHENEQYFFDEKTLDKLASFCSRFKKICVLCAPLLGKRLSKEGLDVTILDVDERFSDLNGFIRYDIYRPRRLNMKFDLIISDPPFFNVTLSQLFDAVRAVSNYDFNQKMMISYLKRRENSILGTFSKFKLEPTGFNPSYQTVKKCLKNDIEFYSNLSADSIKELIAFPR